MTEKCILLRDLSGYLGRVGRRRWLRTIFLDCGVDNLHFLILLPGED